MYIDMSTVLIGRGRSFETIPEDAWRSHAERAARSIRSRHAALPPDHARVRAFAVHALPLNHGRPLAPEQIARELNLPLPSVDRILDDLERGLFFLVRNRRGHVSWAFPVTVDRTPHHLRFDSGERLWGA